MEKIRKVQALYQARPTLEGAGVHLKRAFGNADVTLFDPFLMMDDFSSKNPADYLAGFPWHPHRGIETITYVIAGKITHQDSMGNGGTIDDGCVQWMTAGNGIIHSEMPHRSKELWGFQLWANLPKTHKMMDPRYRDIRPQQIPEIVIEGGKVNLICGEFNKQKGPVQDIITDPSYMDITLQPHASFTDKMPSGYTVFSYVINGTGKFDEKRGKAVGSGNTILYEREGDSILI